MVAAAIICAASSCNKEDVYKSPESESSEYGSITLKVSSEQETKAASSTTEQAYEKSIYSVQLFVFDSSTGKINIYKNMGTSTTASISTTVGNKNVWAVVNGPAMSDISTEAELKAKSITLGNNSKTTGFVMVGSQTCQVTNGGTVNCSISVKRLVARVTVSSIKNQLPASYGAVNLKNIFLSNVVGNQNLNGDQAPSTWYNKEGRANENPLVSAHIINGTEYLADIPELTFKKYTNSIANGGSYNPSCAFYTFANNSTVSPSAFNATFSAQRSVLMITAEIGGVLNYYPVVLSQSTLAANTSYNVDVTFTGTGSTDPNVPVQKGNISVTISVAQWVSGASYDEIL